MKIYYFSLTGHCRKIAKALGKEFGCPVEEIRSFSFPYWLWLILSFIPFLPVKSWFLMPEEEKHILLCFPKWTFNCPPVTYFLKKVPCKEFTFIITHRGWGEKFYEKIYKFYLLILRKKANFHFIRINK